MSTESVRRSRTRDYAIDDTRPVDAVEERFELNPRQTHHAVASLRPYKFSFAKTLVDQHQSRAVPKQDLQPIRSLRTENHDQPGVRIEAERILHESGERIVPAAEIDGPNGDDNLQALRIAARKNVLEACGIASSILLPNLAG